MAKYTKSNLTKKYGRLALIFTLLSLLCFLGPLTYYVVAGFATATLVIQKITLTAAVLFALMATVICAWRRWAFRSKVWVVILALYFIVGNFIGMILAFAITQIVDELILSKLAHHYRRKYDSCKDTDKQFAERGL